MNTLAEKMLTESQVWIYSMCCLRAFASLVCCRSTCELQGPLCPLDSGVAFCFQILPSLLCTCKHHPIPFLPLQGSVFWLCLLGDVWLCWCRCSWGSFHLVMKSEHSGADLVQAGSRKAGRESMPLDFLGAGFCSLHISPCRVDAVKCQPGQGVCLRSSLQDGVGQWNPILWFTGG